MIDDTLSIAHLTKETHRMGLQRKLDGLIVIDHVLAQPHRRQCDGELHSTIVGGRSFEKREGLCSCQGFHLPESGAPIPPQGAESIGGGKLLKGGNGNPGAVA